ncbi:hypothetical protein FOXB_13535 [Fusarium oxysporum f. sp. conglutinans Fo5176]|uniref:Uncharacterized protein n=1 Tax=Fusarium oxysporum (strain Fo5176) TaxID=660025 RepID=F9G4F3_FUSOF|nr:hypothetical protein FOXB_13535 [Fusarium oxysporum f. sp. conglutinans Fo5176]
MAQLDGIVTFQDMHQDVQVYKEVSWVLSWDQ